MPEHKEVVLALLATATGSGAVLLVFQGLLLTIIGNAPLPEATNWTASLAQMLHGYDTILRMAVVFTLLVFLVIMAVIGLAVWWLLFGGDALYQQISQVFPGVLSLIARELGGGRFAVFLACLGVLAAWFYLVMEAIRTANWLNALRNRGWEVY